MRSAKYLIFGAIVVVLCLISQVVLAAPQISSCSGSVAGGELVTIVGQGFGEKPVAAPYKWDNFENGQPGQLVAGWDSGVGSGLATYSDSIAHSGSISSLHDFVKHTNVSLCLNSQSFPVIYLDFWMYVHPLGVFTRNFKPWRFYGNNDQLQFFDNDYCPSANASHFQGYDGSGGGYLEDVTHWHSGHHTMVNMWRHYQVSYRESDPGVANGLVRQWINGKPEGPKAPAVNGTAVTRHGNYHINQIRIGHYWAHDGADGCAANPGAYVYVDDVYVDTTLARVEIGNASTYNDCTHREIQIPTAWSQTSITIRVNQGSFNEGDSAYLFVVDPDGNVSNGYPITIGGGGGEPLDNPPNVSITTPTSGDTYSTSNASVTISGNASDDNGISSITWSNNRGGNGTATNSSGDWTSWSAPVNLQEGENVITVTATDTNNQTATDTITVTYTPSDMVQAWNANDQTNDNDWKDSSVTYCVRLLIEGAQITRSGNQIMLGFKGRSSGDYTIRKVSIAEKDPNGGEGDVIDSTWTKVTFDGKDESTWDTDIITVPAGGEKLSNPIDFPIQAGKDYYVTFKVVTPSVYLNPPAYYTELYFYSDDHTDDVDWSENGHATTQDYHALSSIYVLNASHDTTPPGDVTNASITAGAGQLTLSWTNPTDSDFAGVMIRYRTDGTNPQNATDGQPVPNGNNGKITGAPGASMSYTHSNLDPDTHYYYSIFTYDTSGNYSHTVFLDAQPLPPDNGNQAPTASISASPTSGESPLTVTFSGSGSDSDGTIQSYSWDFGDGTTSSSQNPTHTYARVSSQTQYTVTLTVTDDDGATGQATITITVSPDSTPPSPPSGVNVE